MSKKAPIGYIKCFCGFPDGEIRLDKNKNPYYYCPDCSIQVLTHGGTRGAMFRAKMRPVDLAVKKAMSDQDKKPSSEKKPKEKKDVKKNDGSEIKKTSKKPDQDKKPVPEKKPDQDKKPSFGMMGGNA